MTSGERELQMDDAEETCVPPVAKSADLRVYLPEHEAWVAQIKRSWDTEYCFTANPGEDHFHLLLNGEVFLQKGSEKYCLNCAMRQKVITADRLYWQHSSSSFETVIQPPTEDVPSTGEFPA